MKTLVKNNETKKAFYTITEGITDKGQKSCYSINFDKEYRLSDQDFKSLVTSFYVFKAKVNGEFKPYNVSKKSVDFDLLNNLLKSFKFNKVEKSTKVIETKKEDLKKQITAKNPAKTANNDNSAQITALKDLFNEGIIDKSELLEMIKAIK